MRISKKKWNELEKRVADLEDKVQSQPREIVQCIVAHMNQRRAKSGSTRQYRENQFDVQASICPDAQQK